MFNPETISDVLRQSDNELHIHRIRPSSLPVCVRFEIFNEIFPKHIAEWQTKIPAATFGAEIGTTIHRITQAKLGRSGYLFGHWKCPRCHDITRFHLGSPYCYCYAGLPTRCTYEEIELTHPDGMLIHLDGLIPSMILDIRRGIVSPPDEGNWKDYTYNQLEIKNCGTLAAISGIKTSWKYQNAAYFHALSSHGFQIDRILFMKQARIHANSVEFIPVDPQSLQTLVIETEENVNAAREHLRRLLRDKTVDITKIKGLCRTEADGRNQFCRYTSFCFGRHVYDDVIHSCHERFDRKSSGKRFRSLNFVSKL